MKEKFQGAKIEERNQAKSITKRLTPLRFIINYRIQQLQAEILTLWDQGKKIGALTEWLT